MARETTILKLGPDDAGMRLTAEEFANADFQEPYTYERVKGRLVVMSPAGPEHRKVSRLFRREFADLIANDYPVSGRHAVQLLGAGANPGGSAVIVL